jgi:fatty-acyl-CoA synthase
MNLWDAITAGAVPAHGTMRCSADGRFTPVDWADVIADAERMTAGMRLAGVESGARVAAILMNTPLACRGIIGAWLAGGVIASFPVPSRGMDAAEYVEQLRALSAHLDQQVTFVDAQTLALLPEDLVRQLNIRTWESVADSGKIDPTPPGDDDLAFIQYSSGSMSLPKGCMLTPRAIARQLEMVIEFTCAEPGISGWSSWLPLSHDMGLFGNYLFPLAYRLHLALSTPERFAFSPRSWFEDAARFGSAYTCGTNTALHLAARMQSDRRPIGKLQLRCVVLGAERIEWDCMLRALLAFGPAGLRAEHLMPAYGLAEATLAVTTCPFDEPPRYMTVDSVALADGIIEEVEPGAEVATRIVSSGVPCSGVELPGLESDAVNEVRVRSPSLAEGYYGEEQRTQEHFCEGELRTADIGFARDGYLYPVGRVDDVISIAGRKVYAREIEAAVDGLEGVRKGCTTMIERQIGGRPRLALLMEVGRDSTEFRSLAEEAATIAMRKAAVPLDECLFLKKGTLPKTPSGKIQRYRCRQLLEGRRLVPTATVEL